MLLYSNKAYWRIVFQTRGSLVYSWKNIVTGIFIALVTFIISYFKRHEGFSLVSFVPTNNLGWNMMGGTIVFAVVFRTNLGWQRYWEALGEIQMMYSKWSDAFTQCVGFANVTIADLQRNSSVEASEKVMFLQDKLGSLQRNFSLLSALAAHRLTHGDVHRMEKRCEIADWRHQVVLRRELRIGEDLTGATKLPDFVKVECRSQLNEHLENTWFGDYCVTDEPSEEEVETLAETSDRVHAVMYWVIHDLAEISSKLTIPPPIQSRMYQELSNGMLGLQSAIKIADVPFPFQFTQLFNVLVIAFSTFIPIYASVFTESLILSPLIAYVVHQSILIINQLAMQLETPFGTGYNDISVKDFHARFLETIIEINPISKLKCNQNKKQLTARESVINGLPGLTGSTFPKEGKRRPSVMVEYLGKKEHSSPTLQRNESNQSTKSHQFTVVPGREFFGISPSSHSARSLSSSTAREVQKDSLSSERSSGELYRVDQKDSSFTQSPSIERRMTPAASPKRPNASQRSIDSASSDESETSSQSKKSQTPKEVNLEENKDDSSKVPLQPRSNDEAATQACEAHVQTGPEASGNTRPRTGLPGQASLLQ